MPSLYLFQVLLTSDKAAANFSDRSLLKNLGHWLGMITLAKNKPILYTVRICDRCFGPVVSLYSYIILHNVMGLLSYYMHSSLFPRTWKSNLCCWKPM